MFSDPWHRSMVVLIDESLWNSCSTHMGHSQHTYVPQCTGWKLLVYLMASLRFFSFFQLDIETNKAREAWCTKRHRSIYSAHKFWYIKEPWKRRERERMKRRIVSSFYSLFPGTRNTSKLTETTWPKKKFLHLTIVSWIKNDGSWSGAHPKCKHNFQCSLCILLLSW